MIFNTVIINGVATMTKTGAYFSIISASGIVRVKLTKAGSTVLDSKMWVGMSINHAMPFDEIEIYGNDGAVEFWAGDLSMTNQGAVMLRGATAINTSKVAVMGTQLLTDNNLTRNAIRVRTDKDIYIGGASVDGTGWRVPANATEEIPVAGALYAYKQKPLIKITDSVYTGTITGKFIDTIIGDKVYISPDEQTVLQWAFNRTPQIWSQAGGWVKHSSFIEDYVNSFGMLHDKTSKHIYGVIMSAANGPHSFSSGNFKIYKSVDDGLTFDVETVIDWSEMLSPSLVNNTSTTMNLVIVGNVLTISLSGCAVGWNMLTGEVRAVAAGNLPSQAVSSAIAKFWFVDDEMTQANFLSNKDYELRTSTDSLQSWATVGQKFTSLNVGEGGRYVSGWDDYGTDKIRFSDDGGISFHASDYRAKNGVPDNVAYFYDGMWLVFYGDTLVSYQVVDGVLMKDVALATHVTASGDDIPYILPDGKLFRFTEQKTVAGFLDVDTWQVSITGDTEPALVEIMELLS